MKGRFSRTMKLLSRDTNYVEKILLLSRDRISLRGQCYDRSFCRFWLIIGEEIVRKW
jgi:hypothetical protein